MPSEAAPSRATPSQPRLARIFVITSVPLGDRGCASLIDRAGDYIKNQKPRKKISTNRRLKKSPTVNVTAFFSEGSA
jgi:hypothetical protein